MAGCCPSSFITFLPSCHRAYQFSGRRYRNTKEWLNDGGTWRNSEAPPVPPSLGILGLRVRAPRLPASPAFRSTRGNIYNIL